MENVLFTQLSVSEIKAIIREAVEEIFVKHQGQSERQDDEDIILNFEEACKLIQIAAPTLYKYTSQNVIPHIKRARKLYFIKADLLEWLKAGKRKNIGELTKRENFFRPYMRKQS